MNPLRPDVVFDSNTLFQAIVRADSPAAEALRLMERNEITLHSSRATLREFRRIVGYRRIRERYPQLTRDSVDEFLAWLLYRGELVKRVPRAIRYPRDPADEPFLDLAVAVSADFLLSRDHDLLALASDHSLVAKALRKRLPRLRIVTPEEFLGQMADRRSSN